MISIKELKQNLLIYFPNLEKENSVYRQNSYLQFLSGFRINKISYLSFILKWWLFREEGRIMSEKLDRY